jgi:hypothetical protein
MWRVVAMVAGLWIAQSSALAAGGEPGAALQRRVETTNLTRTDLLLATLYNDHRLAYAVATTLSMALVGVAIAVSVDAVLGQFGLRVSRIDHRE